MKYKHRADLYLAKWLDDLCDEKMEKKASSDVFVPYGGQERATQLHSDIVDSLLVEEKQDDEMAEMEKKIEEAETPEELKKIEEELEGKVDKAEDVAKEKAETPAEEPKEKQPSEEKPEEESKEPTEEKPSDDPNVDNLKKEVDMLKEEVDELNGEEKMQREIDILRKRLDNISVQDDPDLNDSIFQESSLKQAGKITIELKNPKDAKSKRVQKIIEKHVNDGGKFKDITINYDFFAPPNVIKSVRGELQKYYNRLAFERDKKNRASMLSDIRYARRLVRRIKEANPVVQQMIQKQLQDKDKKKDDDVTKKEWFQKMSPEKQKEYLKEHQKDVPSDSGESKPVQQVSKDIPHADAIQNHNNDRQKKIQEMQSTDGKGIINKVKKGLKKELFKSEFSRHKTEIEQARDKDLGFEKIPMPMVEDETTWKAPGSNKSYPVDSKVQDWLNGGKEPEGYDALKKDLKDSGVLDKYKQYQTHIDQVNKDMETLKAASLDKESGMKPTPNGKVLYKDVSNLLKGWDGEDAKGVRPWQKGFLQWSYSLPEVHKGSDYEDDELRGLQRRHPEIKTKDDIEPYFKKERAKAEKEAKDLFKKVEYLAKRYGTTAELHMKPKYVAISVNVKNNKLFASLEREYKGVKTMDEIQKELVKAGRKDLAQKYYEKVSAGLKIMDTGELVKEKPKGKKTKYKGFTITVYKSPRWGLYWATNDIGEPYNNVPLFRTEREALNWDKKNVDQYVKESSKDKYKVDMTIVRKHDSSPPYLKLLRKEIKNGDGFVEIKEKKGDYAEVYAADSNSWMLGTIRVPMKSLKKANQQYANKIAANVDPKVKKEFQSYVKEIWENLKKHHPEFKELDVQKEFNKIAYTITNVIMAMNPSNANHGRMKKYFPRKYNVELINNGDGNTYDSEWFKMTDNQQWTIVRKGLKVATKIAKLTMEETYNKLQETPHDREAQKELSDNIVNWGKDLLKKYNLKLSPSNFKKAKPSLKAELSSLNTSGDKTKTFANIIAKVMMVKDGRNPKQFNLLVDYVKKPEANVYKRMTDVEKYMFNEFVRYYMA